MKKLTSFLLTIVILITTTIPAFATASQPEVTPYLNNTRSATATFSITASGNATASYSYNAKAEYFTKAVVTTKIQKRTLGLVWTTVDIGQPNNKWTDTWYTATKAYSHSYQLSKSGTYRAVVEFTISGTNGSPDVIEVETNTFEYSA